jgi:hypothetical protein
MKTRQTLTTYICGKGYILVDFVSFSILQMHARVFCPSIFIAQEPQIPVAKVKSYIYIYTFTINSGKVKTFATRAAKCQR